VQKYIIAAEATDDIMAHSQYALDSKGYEHRLSEYVILLPFHCNIGCTNVPHCHIIRT